MDEAKLLRDFEPVYEYLDGHNIYEVRNLARAFGINSPTSEKKHALIVRLIGVASGMAPPEQRSNKGARVKASDASAERVAKVRSLIEECAAQLVYPPAGEPPRLEFHDADPARRGYGERCLLGMVETNGRGPAFLRAADGSSSESDPVISEKKVRAYRLRDGDLISGYVSAEKGGPAEMTEFSAVNGAQPLFIERPLFDELPAVYPEERVPLGAGGNAALCAADYLCPVGKGQRAMICGRPGTGKSLLVREAAASVQRAMPEAELLFILPAFRPEEETELREMFPRAAVLACAYGRPAGNFARNAKLLAERAKRVAESGRDAVLLVDSLDALARVFREAPAQNAVYECEKLFTVGRQLRGAGSVTVLAVAPDEAGEIAQACAGAANAVLYLAEEAAAPGVYPAIDFFRSATRRAETLLREEEEAFARTLRETLADEGAAAMLRRAQEGPQN